jgi:hypothetical protein
MAVCGHCRSTLVRHDLDLENLGVMAELAEDRGPFRLRWRGRYQGVGFELIGRLQLRYAQGYWNEWYARFDDDRLGWLSEGSGLCYVTFERGGDGALPAFGEVMLGLLIQSDGTRFTITNIERARCVAAEGELPFQATPGYEAPVVDLRSERRFASIDYSEKPPRVYVGEAVTLDALIDPADPAGSVPPEFLQPAEAQARHFQCTNCGAPLSVRSAAIHAVGCEHCGAVVDPDSPELAILSKAQRKLEAPLLKLGGQGKLRGRLYTVIGFLRQTTTIEGQRYRWDEYLLHAKDAGYAWLTCSDGHWNLGKPVTHQPKIVHTGHRLAHFLDSELPELANLKHPRARFLGRDFRHFQLCRAEVEQVMGEFTWQVKIGDTVTVDDYIAPPHVLSRERSDTELTWTLAEYVPVAEVTAAFAPERPLPEPVGVAPSQPSPHPPSRRYWLAFGALAALALLMQLFFVGRAARDAVWQGDLIVPAGQQKAQLTTEPFRIDDQRNLEIQQNTNLDNSWLYVDLSLINRQTGETYWVGREFSYYHGRDIDGYRWREGERHGSELLGAVPAGEYVLTVEAETEVQKNELIDRIRLVRDVPVWSSYWLLLAVLALVPLWTWLHETSFERRRWSGSDYSGSP